MITRLIWTPVSSVPKKADKLNLSHFFVFLFIHFSEVNCNLWIVGYLCEER